MTRDPIVERAMNVVRSFDAYVQNNTLDIRLLGVRNSIEELRSALHHHPRVTGPDLAALRLTKGLRVGEVARAWGVHPSRVSRLERMPTVTEKAAFGYEDAVKRAVELRALPF